MFINEPSHLRSTAVTLFLIFRCSDSKRISNKRKTKNCTLGYVKAFVKISNNLCIENQRSEILSTRRISIKATKQTKSNNKIILGSTLPTFLH